MRQGLKKFIMVLGVVVIALNLFMFGMDYPTIYRYFGSDARNYLNIANSFDSLSTAFSYAGDRGVGMPLFAFVIRKVLVFISPENDLQLFSGHFLLIDNVRIWVDAICFVLFAIHLLSAWLFSIWARRTDLLKSENATILLFAFLATFPAFIGHTTVFLSDTLDVDLILCAIVSLERALSSKKLFGSIMLTCAAAFLFAYAILVRPGTLLPVAIPLALASIVAMFRGRRNTIILGATALGCMLMLAPFYRNCTDKFGTSCLQSPKTFDAVGSARLGMIGTRVLWERKPANGVGIGVLPDAMMASRYHDQCHLTSILGLSDESFTGCLLARPATLPIFLGKKWIGLFDHFRFTPYTESHTPFWLKWLSRTYDSFAWMGFSLLLIALPRQFWVRSASNVKTMVTENITSTLLLGFSVLMLAELSVFHVEDRYSLPLIPICATVLMMAGERTLARYRSAGWKSVLPICLYCAIGCTLYITQIIIWDISAGA